MPAEEIESVLRPGTWFEGLVSLVRSGRIDGRLCGDVVARGALWIGEAGRVEGRIEAEEVIVAGEVAGEVRARSRIELLPTARVLAALDTPCLVAAEGCYLQGTCSAGAEGRHAGAPEGPQEPSSS